MATRSASSGHLSPLFTWRSAVASETGPVDYDLPVKRGGEETTTVVKGATQRHVALTLSLHMNEKGSSCYPGVPLVSRESALTERTVQRAVRALEETGWLTVAIGKAPDGTNLYTATIPDTYEPPEGAYWVRGWRTEYTGGGVPGTPKSVIESGSSSLDDVCRAWSEHAPPLIEHRGSYLAATSVKNAIRTACRTYPPDVVAAAIGNYATVLGSDDYRWSYRWTLVDFLRRGLDRFVPEAKPLENFRSRTSGGADAPGFDAVDDL